MELIYRTTITNVGRCAEQFLTQNMFVIFNENVPQELIDYCYIHNENNLLNDIKVDDILIIDGWQYKITAVGSVVNQNLRNLGHITFKFSGETEAAIPGTLFLEKKEIVPLKNGTTIEIIRA
ncbi:PTS glucitol/sorbitol transporter subunit IIA [Fonticella tunisiensis]|uniref:PTS system glucitol/sorbitol-specific IIA component n=1 Tax=Fonticella tunisiensis TaxID=1096341 RepID=A0A4R7KEC5_9CLOT|nr:PTS glucitol/sorbitol transporter subunit IIA [Fonticella tunisiensis]TDT51911.1 PTS system glucitol/sorbitol-specific IIA component [Fonticella tunisiensis]